MAGEELIKPVEDFGPVTVYARRAGFLCDAATIFAHQLGGRRDFFQAVQSCGAVCRRHAGFDGELPFQ